MAADRCQKRVTPGIEFLFRKPRPRRCRSDSSFSHDHRCLMFNTRLKRELSALREELSSLQQVKESLESEMLCLTLDAEGRVEWANANFLQELAYSMSQLLGGPLTSWCRPTCVRTNSSSVSRTRWCAVNTLPVPCACCAATARKRGCVRSCSRCAAPTGASSIFRFSPATSRAPSRRRVSTKT